MINGAPTDNNAASFKRGAHKILDASGITIGAEYDTPDWSPDKAQQEMEQAITKLGRDRIVGVYAANDGTASGAIAAMRSAGFAPLPPVTGMDAELSAIQAVLDGSQYMTVYKAVKAEATSAATIAIALARGEQPTGITGTVDNGTNSVPAVLLDPVAVTADNIKATVVADQFWTAAQICTQDRAAACHTAGIA
jgi:D-xylose transport system substrate-binding protein